MTEPLPPALSILDQRLQRTAGGEPPPHLRHRVLMAVDDVLSPRPHVPFRDRSTTIPGWAWAVAAVITVAMAWPSAMLPRSSFTSDHDGLALAARLRAAGVSAEDLVTAIVPTEAGTQTVPTIVAPGNHAAPSAPAARRSLETRHLLQELL